MTIHSFLVHYFLLGFVSWDGLTYRLAPIVELVQNGHLGLSKYNQWAFRGYLPFVELTQYPFLALFKLKGILIGWPLVVFPLSVASVYVFAREVTKSERSGVFGALAFAAIPFVNQQAASGYIDFAVCGILAFFLYAALRFESDEPSWRSLSRFALAAMLFSMSRSQGVYVGALLLPLVLAFTSARWEGPRPRDIDWRRLSMTIAAFLVGVAPAIATQLWRYKYHGSPLAPFRLELPGLTIGEGMTRRALFSFGGLEDETPAAYLRAFASSWIWPRYWPPGSSFDSRNLGGGFIFPLAVGLVVAFARQASRRTMILAVFLALTSVLTREFWLPRYAYCLVLAMVLVIGCALDRLATKGKSAAFFAALAVVLVHFARPEWDLLTRNTGIGIGPQFNATESSYFMGGSGVVPSFPDRGAKLVIIEITSNGFVLQLYGPQLTNTVVKTIPASSVGPHCEGLTDTNDVFYVDDGNVTATCTRECGIMSPNGYCHAYHIHRP